jgi:hypothetical protein
MPLEEGLCPISALVSRENLVIPIGVQSYQNVGRGGGQAALVGRYFGGELAALSVTGVIG